MIQEYRCRRCRHLLFKGSLKLLQSKQHNASKEYIEPMCPKCGLVNRFSYQANQIVEK